MIPNGSSHCQCTGVVTVTLTISVLGSIVTFEHIVDVSIAIIHEFVVAHKVVEGHVTDALTNKTRLFIVVVVIFTHLPLVNVHNPPPLDKQVVLVLKREQLNDGL